MEGTTVVFFLVWRQTPSPKVSQGENVIFPFYVNFDLGWWFWVDG